MSERNITAHLYMEAQIDSVEHLFHTIAPHVHSVLVVPWIHMHRDPSAWKPVGKRGVPQTDRTIPCVPKSQLCLYVRNVCSGTW
jgi:hypothetical protein